MTMPTALTPAPAPPHSACVPAPQLADAIHAAWCAGATPRADTHLGRALRVMQAAGVLDERGLQRAVRAELTLAHGARIDDHRLVAGADRLLAVAFTATVPAGRADPVALVWPWTGLTAPMQAALADYSALVTRMLVAGAQAQTAELRYVISQWPPRVPAVTSGFTLAELLLWGEATATNIELCVAALAPRAARPAGL